MDSDQRLLATKIGRVMERAVREGNALDTEALCVQSGKWVWRLNVDVTVLDDSGNVLDGSLLAAVAALRHFRLPEVAHVDETPIVLHSDDQTPQAGNLICAMIAGNGMIIHVTFVIHTCPSLAHL